MSFEATKQVGAAKLAVKLAAEKIDELEYLSASGCDTFRRGGGARGRSVEDFVIRKDAMVETLRKQMNRWMKLEEESEKELESVEDLELRNMIILRYVKQLPWAEIGNALGRRITADAVKKRFERGIREYEKKRATA